MRVDLKSCLVLVVVAIGMSSAWGQGTYTWNGAQSGSVNGGTAWFRANTSGVNWLGGTSGKMPGVDLNATSTIDGNTNDVATFNVVGTLGNVLGMSNSASSGVTSNSAGNGLLSVGAIANISSVTNSVAFSASSASPTPPGILQLNGAYSANTASLATNTLLSATGGNITISRGTTNLLDVRLGIDGGVISTASGRTITLTSNLIELTGSAKGFTKNGDGILNFNGDNSYTGITTIDAGNVNINGNSSAATGALIVNNTGLLGGTGTVGGSTTVNSGGTIRGSTGGLTAGPLTTGNVTVNSGGIIFSNLGDTTVSSKLALGANTLDLKTNSILKLDDVTGFAPASGHTWNIAELTSGTTLQLNTSSVADGFVFGTYVQGSGSTGAVIIDVTSLPALAAGDQLILSRSGNNLVLTFVPVPEPALLFGLAAGLMGIGAAVRKKFFAVVTAA